MDSNPLPSEPVDTAGIHVLNFELTRESRLFMNLEWAVPEVTYGPVEGYEYRVTAVPLDNADSAGNQAVLPLNTITVTLLCFFM